MSHFSELKTQLLEERFLKAALKKMGFQLEENPEGVSVRGFMGDTFSADFKALTSTHYDIGFKKGNLGYELVADWELMPRVAGIEKEAFVAHLKREYARTAIETVAKDRGYEVQTVENEAGEIEMRVVQW